jgi:antitoxin (DNA-binding transcriptional repressor) of toxin-antitoxin stability system
MKRMTVGEFKTHFSDVIEQVKSGEKIAVTFGKKKEVVGYFTPEMPGKETKRKLGILEGKASVEFHTDFEITTDEFLGL